MHEFLPFIIIGLATGAVYGLAGTGLVLTYKTSGIFNFGYGSIAALASFLFFFLHVEHGWAWPLVAVLCLLVFAPLVGLVLERVARSLEGASEIIKVVATVGFILIVWSLALLWHPTNAPTFPHFLPQSTVRILGVNISWEQIILFAFSVTASAVLYWFFQSVRLGMVMRGVVDNNELVSMSGDDPVRVRRWAWIIGTVFAAVAGLMLAPTQPIDGITLTTVTFGAFGAAAIGYFTNLPLTFVGGLLIGVAGALVDKYAATITWVGGLPPGLPFVILFLVLIFMPRSRLAMMRVPARLQVPHRYRMPARLQVTMGVVTIALLALMPVIQSGRTALWSAALIDMILFLSLGLLVKRSGQISLCVLAFAAVGGAAFGHFAGRDGIPWLVSLVLAALVAVPVGALIAVPAVRVSGVFLALATLGFSILAEQVFYSRGYMFGQSTLGIAEPRPAVSIGGWNLASDRGFYYLLLVIAFLVVLFVTAISRGRLGRLLEAMADSPVALETHGTASSVLKVIVFCVAAALASLAGALTADLYHFGVGSYYTTFNSIYLVVIVVILNIHWGDPWYAIGGAVAYAVLPGYIHGATTNTVLQLMFGVSAVTVVFAMKKSGTSPRVQRFLDRLGGRKPQAEIASTPAPLPTAVRPPAEAVSAGAARPGGAAGEGLALRNVTVRFGGVVAVNDVSLRAPSGLITGLVGPNGAGKTTIFNACSGLLRQNSGHVFLHGVDVTPDSTPSRARRGLGRTFQRTELFDSLTVRQNVAMGREAAMAGGNPVSQVVASRAARRDIARATEEALAVTGIQRLANTQVGPLPIGQRRLVELARILAGPFDVLLLDEPSSGLDGRETEEFAHVLTTVVRERGCAMLLVEHDMTLVRQVCDRVYVLDFGSLIFEGTPAEMLASDVVRAAYLGDALPAYEDLSDDVMDEAERESLA